jgi:flagellar biogenesis protein FliO
MDALAAEGLELASVARRLAPTRRRGVLVGLAMLAVIALAGVAGASEPEPATRSALEAFSAPAVSATPATSAAPVASAAAATAAAATPAASPLGLPVGAIGSASMFTGPDPLDLILKGALVIAALFVTLRILRRVQGGTGGKATGMLDVVESRNLGPKTQLHLVAVGDRRFMVGQTPAGLVALGELDAAELATGGGVPLLAATSALASSMDLAASADAAAPELLMARPAPASTGAGRPSRARSTVGADRGSGALSITSLYADAPAPVPVPSQSAAPREDRPAQMSAGTRAATSATATPNTAATPAPAPVTATSAPDPRASDAERLGGETRQERLARLARQEAQDRADRQARIARAERAARVEQAFAVADHAARVAATAAAAAERAALAGRTAQAVERTGLAPVTMAPGLAPRPVQPVTRRPDPAARLAGGRGSARAEGVTEIEARLIERLTSMDLEGRSADRAYGVESTFRPRDNARSGPGRPTGENGIPAARERLTDRLARTVATRLQTAVPATRPASASVAPATGLPAAQDDPLDDPRRFASDLDEQPLARTARRYEASA